jgi:hypothetical protein
VKKNPAPPNFAQYRTLSSNFFHKVSCQTIKKKLKKAYRKGFNSEPKFTEYLYN